METGERAILTFIQAFLAAFVITDISSAKMAALSGIAATLSVLKSIIATHVGDHTNTSLV
jgi:hypothetical protein